MAGALGMFLQSWSMLRGPRCPMLFGVAFGSLGASVGTSLRLSQVDAFRMSLRLSSMSSRVTLRKVLGSGGKSSGDVFWACLRGLSFRFSWVMLWGCVDAVRNCQWGCSGENDGWDFSGGLSLEAVVVCL